MPQEPHDRDHDEDTTVPGACLLHFTLPPCLCGWLECWRRVFSHVFLSSVLSNRVASCVCLNSLLSFVWSVSQHRARKSTCVVCHRLFTVSRCSRVLQSMALARCVCVVRCGIPPEVSAGVKIMIEHVPVHAKQMGFHVLNHV